MSAAARGALSILAVAIGIAGVAQRSDAADTPSNPPAAAAPSAQRAQATLEILLDQRAHQQRVQAADIVGVSGAQAKLNALSSAQTAAQGPNSDGQAAIQVGVPNNLDLGSAATTVTPDKVGTDPSAAGVPQSPTSLGRDLPAVSAESKKLSSVPESGKDTASPPQQ